MSDENPHNNGDGSANGDPSHNGENGHGTGRDRRGRFAKGNAGGPGNPHAKEVANIREALLQAITPEAAKAIAGQLIKKAKAGNLPAIKELLDRVCGKSVAKIEAEVTGQKVALTPDEMAAMNEFNQKYLYLGDPANNNGDLP